MCAARNLDTYGSFDFPSTGRALGAASKIPSYGAYDMGSAAMLPQTHDLARFIGRARLYATIQSYSNLEAGWDGYSAEAGMPESILGARLFVSVLPDRFDLPVPMLASDGEISLYWETADAYLEASFPGDGTFHYIFNAPGKRFASDDIEISVPNINKQFLGCLEAI